VIHVLGGGTVSHVRAHLALAAVAYGGTARKIAELCREMVYLGEDNEAVRLHLTRMAEGPRTANAPLETNEDVADFVSRLIGEKSTRIVFHTVAHCDWRGEIDQGEYEDHVESGKYAQRMRTREDTVGHLPRMTLRPEKKIISEYRRHRKDIFLVACKTTAGATSDDQYRQALRMLKENSCNLVLANDVVTRNNMIVTPEETRYAEGKPRDEVLAALVNMALARSQGTFTRSTVLEGDLVPFDTSPLIPENLREVVRHCQRRGAYKSFGASGSTAGHFAVRVGPGACLTSRRKTNYNAPGGLDLVRVEYDGLEKVLAYGAKPSVGGQSQRIVFEEHAGYDCIVHFHCPLKPGAMSRWHMGEGHQWRNECGSHQCGQETSTNLRGVHARRGPRKGDRDHRGLLRSRAEDWRSSGAGVKPE
jgi:hypothetical protein